MFQGPFFAIQMYNIQKYISKLYVLQFLSDITSKDLFYWARKHQYFAVEYLNKVLHIYLALH